MNIQSRRESIPGVETVYLLSTESLSAFLQDLDAQLYQHIHLNFLDPLDSASLDRLASHVAVSPCNPIQSIHQHNLLFQSLTPRLFSNNIPSVYT